MDMDDNKRKEERGNNSLLNLNTKTSIFFIKFDK